MIRQAVSEVFVLDQIPDVALSRGVREHLPFGDAKFDFVLIYSTLDHCIDADRTLAEAACVLKPEGSILISLQIFSSWQRALVKTVMPGRYRKHRHEDHHTIEFSPVTLRGMLKDHAFTNIAMRETGYLNVSRYKLGFLDRLFFAVPKRIGGERAAVTTLDGVERPLRRLAAGSWGWDGRECHKGRR